jgi:helix-turn-helix protein
MQEKRVTEEGGRREKADAMMAKIKGRTMVEPEKDDVSTLQKHIQAIMEVPKQSEQDY